MGITLAQLLGNTPDALKSVNEDVPNSEMKNKYVWYLRDTDRLGLNVKIDPSKSGDRWVVEVYNVNWNGQEFVEEPRARKSSSHDKFSDAVSCANQMVRDICRDDEELSYILKEKT
jgi:hypothetical protein